MGVLKPLVVSFGRANTQSHVVSSSIFAPSPLFQHLIHLLSFIPGLPFPFTCVWSFQSSHWHVFSILFMCILFTLHALILIAHALDPFCAFSMHIWCFRSSLHTFYAHQVLSILITHIKLYTLSVFDPCYMCSMCIRCCRSLLHIFCMHQVLSILATCILCALGASIHFPCVPSAFNPCCMCSMHIRCC